jgi:hypothetical protein
MSNSEQTERGESLILCFTLTLLLTGAGAINAVVETRRDATERRLDP